MSKPIIVSFQGAIEFTPEQVWPDEDERPEEITAEAVAQAMQDYGSKGRVLDDWSLLHFVEVFVDVGPTGEQVWPDAR